MKVSNSCKNSDGVCLKYAEIFSMLLIFIPCFKFSIRQRIAGSISVSNANLFSDNPVFNLLSFINFPNS